MKTITKLFLLMIFSIGCFSLCKGAERIDLQKISATSSASKEEQKKLLAKYIHPKLRHKVFGQLVPFLVGTPLRLMIYKKIFDMLDYDSSSISAIIIMALAPMMLVIGEPGMAIYLQNYLVPLPKPRKKNDDLGSMHAFASGVIGSFLYAVYHNHFKSDTVCLKQTLEVFGKDPHTLPLEAIEILKNSNEALNVMTSEEITEICKQLRAIADKK